MAKLQMFDGKKLNDKHDGEHAETRHLIKQTLSEQIFNEVLFERKRQYKKFGVQNHSAEKWMLILIEEVGEVATGMLNYANAKEREKRAFWNAMTYNHSSSVRKVKSALENFRTELVQVAAVAVAAIESIDSNNH